MSYSIYSTNVLILRAVPAKEADMLYYCSSPEMGLIWARAQGVRNNGSKNRYSLGIFNQVKIELVRGKNEWRLVGASLIKADVLGVKETKVFSRIASILEKLTLNEHKDEPIHRHLLDFYEQLASHQLLFLDEYMLFELYALSRILLLLGYWSEEEYSALSEITHFERRKIAMLDKELLMRAVNKSLYSSMIIEDRGIPVE